MTLPAPVARPSLELDLHVLDRLGRRHPRRTVDEVGDRDAFDQVGVAAARPAAQRQQRGAGLILVAHKLRIARLDHAWRRDRRVEGVAAEDWNRGNLRRRHGRRHRRGGALDNGRLRGHRELFRQSADFEREVLDHDLLRRDAEALPLFGAETGQGHADGVDTRKHARERVLADLVRRRRAHGVGVFVDERDVDARDDALRVLDQAAHASLIRLRDQACGCDERDRNSEDMPHARTSPLCHCFSFVLWGNARRGAVTTSCEGARSEPVSGRSDRRARPRGFALRTRRFRRHRGAARARTPAHIPASTTPNQVQECRRPAASCTR